MSGPALLPFRRFRVIYRKEGSRRLLSVETMGGKEPRRTRLFGEPVLVFSEQERGGTHIMSAEFVERVVIEQSDRNGEWHEVGQWPIEEQPS